MHKTRTDRQQARDNRTTREQLRIIRQRPGKSTDETARLLRLRALEA